MKKKLLIGILLLVCFWHFNVRADDDVAAIPDSDPEVAEIGVGEIPQAESEDEDENEGEALATGEAENPLQIEGESANVFSSQNQGNGDAENLTDGEKIEEKNIGTKSGLAASSDGSLKEEANPNLNGSSDGNTDTATLQSDGQGESAEPEIVEPKKEALDNNDAPMTKAGEGQTAFEYTMAQGDKMTVDALLNELAITLPEGVTVTSVTSSNASVVKVQNGLIECLSAIDSSNPPTLTITLSDETTYTVTIKKAPDHDKNLIDNGDGTYDIELTVTGETIEIVTKANVIIVMDASNSMIQNYTEVRAEYTYSSSTYNSNREYYSSETGTGRVYYRNGNWRTSNSNNGTVYTGTVWLRLNRLETEKLVLCDLVDELLANNIANDENKKDIIEISIITYNATASSDVLSNSYDATTIKNKINSVTNDQGTNWESGMKAAVREAEALKSSEANEEVYTIFLTDGQPTEYDTATGHSNVNTSNYWLNWNPAMNEARDLGLNYHLYTIYTYGSETRFINFLDNLTHYAYQVRDYDNNDDDTDGKYNYGSYDEALGRNEHFHDARNTDDLIEAFKAIAGEINKAGIGNVDIVDGTTNKVVTSVGLTHNLLTVDPDSFRYYIDKDEWTTIPANAKASLNSDGEVVWDLTNIDPNLLQNGKTYKVVFTVWPSQETLDLIADLKNGTVLYDYSDDEIIFDSDTNKYYIKGEDGKKTDQEVIDPEIKQYLIEVENGDKTDYILRTNTTATLSFTDSRPNGTDNGNASFVNPDPVGTAAVDLLAVTKKWYGDDERDVEFWVARDNEPWFRIPMDTSEDEVTGGAYIAIGIIRDGEVLETGHDYSFIELGNDAYHWEIKDNKIYRPMLIDNVPTLLARDDAAEEDFYLIGGHKYVVVDATVTTFELIAENYRRANVDIKKEVLGNYNPEGYNFEFTIQASSPKTADPHDDYIWFTVYKETVDENGNSSLERLANNVVIGALTTYYGTGDNQVHAEVDEATGNVTGTFYVKSGVEFKILMQDNWSLRIKNLLTGSTYKVSESTGTEYELVSVNGDKNVKNVDAKVTTIGETPSYTFENRFKVKNITVTKVWTGAESQDGATRPTVTIELLKEGNNTPIETKVLNEGNNWTWTDLPAMNGTTEIIYVVREVTGDAIVTQDTPGKYTYTLAGTEAGGYIVTNKYVPLVTSVTVTKVWTGAESQDAATRPTVTIELVNEGTGALVDTQVLTEAKDWTYTWTNLPANAAGADINYIVREVTGDAIVTQDTPGKYTYTLTGTEAGGYTVTNKYVPLVTTVTVTKVWSDNANQDGDHPESVNVQLYANNSKYGEEITLSEDNDWTYTWEELALNVEGALIDYTVKEIETDNIIDATTVTEQEEGNYYYTVSGSQEEGYTITNTYVPETIDITVKKIWEDESNKEGFRPESITIELFADGDKIDEVELSGEKDEWSYTWTGLDKYAEGKEIDYTINEVEVEHYETEIDGFTITNSREVECTSATVKKVWDDSDDQDGKRPESITVTLSNGTKVTLNEENEWTATVEDLIKYADGKEIEYTWTEADVEGYELTNTEVEGTITTLTNTHEPATIIVIVEKVWADDDNESGKRPTSVTIALLANTKEIDEVVLSEENGWRHVFENLQAYDDGEEIEYTVLEKDVPEDYEASYEYTEEDGNFKAIVHNVLGKGGDNPPPDKNPQTGDNILLYLITLLLGMIGLIGGKLYLKENN